MQRSSLLGIFVSMLAAMPSVASDLDTVIGLAQIEFLSWTLTAKLDIGEGARYDLLPSGLPAQEVLGDRSGRMRFAAPAVRQGVLFPAGSRINPRFFDFEVEERQVRIRLGKAREGTEWTRISTSLWAVLVIAYEQPITAADLAPDALARALSGLFDITGPNLTSGGALQAKLDRVLEPIAILGTSARFEGLLLETPTGWTPIVYGPKLIYERPQDDAQIFVLSFEISEVEASAAQSFLTRTLPDRMAGVLRSHDRKSRIEGIAQPRPLGPFVVGSAEGWWRKFYNGRSWLLDLDNRKAYELIAMGRASAGKELRTSLDRIVSSAAPAPPSAASAMLDPAPARSHAATTSTLGPLDVEARPSVAQRGQAVQLILRFDVLGPSDDPTDVVESWTLSFNGTTLPSYPFARRIRRARGVHEAAFEQVIPADAPLGFYKVKGEVCVVEDCASRTATFEVQP